MIFFWRQPTYQSDLDVLLVQRAKDDPALPARKEGGMKARWKKAPSDTDYIESFFSLKTPPSP
jgi:hypothetical protein